MKPVRVRASISMAKQLKESDIREEPSQTPACDVQQQLVDVAIALPA